MRLAYRFCRNAVGMQLYVIVQETTQAHFARSEVHANSLISHELQLLPRPRPRLFPGIVLWIGFHHALAVGGIGSKSEKPRR